MPIQGIPAGVHRTSAPVGKHRQWMLGLVGRATALGGSTVLKVQMPRTGATPGPLTAWSFPGLLFGIEDIVHLGVGGVWQSRHSHGPPINAAVNMCRR
eukprot:scaffold33734_cov135-Isochrysis_galbana.AAC.2